MTDSYVRGSRSGYGGARLPDNLRFHSNAGAPTDGANEVQEIAISGTPTGGTFTLTFGGQTTGNIAYNASAATVQTALRALSSIGSPNVVCTGGALPGTAVAVTFASALAGTNVAQMTADDSNLTGGTTPAVAISTTTAGVTGTLKGEVNPGTDWLFDTTNGNMYAVAGTSTTPTFKLVTRAS